MVSIIIHFVSSPQGKRFRSKAELQKYLLSEEHVHLDLDAFDFNPKIKVNSERLQQKERKAGRRKAKETNQTTKNHSQLDVGEMRTRGIKTKMKEKNNTEAIQEIKHNKKDKINIKGEIAEASCSVKGNRLAAVPLMSVQAASEPEGENKEEEEEEEASDDESDRKKRTRTRSGISSPARNTQNGKYPLKTLPI